MSLSERKLFYFKIGAQIMNFKLGIKLVTQAIYPGFNGDSITFGFRYLRKVLTKLTRVITRLTSSLGMHKFFI